MNSDMKQSLLVISMLAAMALPASSQEDSCKTIHRIALDAVPSTIFHTNEFCVEEMMRPGR